MRAVSTIVLCTVPFSTLIHTAVSLPAFHTDCVSLCGIIDGFLNGSNTSHINTAHIWYQAPHLHISTQNWFERWHWARLEWQERVFQLSKKKRFPPLSQQPLLLASLWFHNCACAIRSKRDAHGSLGIHAAASPSLAASCFRLNRLLLPGENVIMFLIQFGISMSPLISFLGVAFCPWVSGWYACSHENVNLDLGYNLNFRLFPIDRPAGW